MLLLHLLLLTWFDWKTIKTEDFTVIYKPDYYWEAMQTLENLEYYHDYVVTLTDNDTRNVPVVLEDVGTTSNGFSDPFLYNLHIFTYSPGYGTSLEGIENWFRQVSIHEYIHIAHLTKTAGVSEFLTGAIGAPFQSNMYSPGWLIEGISVWGESQISPYEGRLNDGFYDSYIAARVYDNEFPSIIEATNSPLTFPADGIYLYGGEFFDFLSERYGEERFSRFFHVYGSYFWAPISVFVPSVGIDLAAKKVYGKSFPSLFSEWHDYAERRFLDWRMQGQRVTNKGWYLSSLVSNDDKLYFTRFKPVKVDAFSSTGIIEIVELEPLSGEEKTLNHLNSSITTPMKIHKGNLYYTTRELKRGTANVALRGFGATSVMHKSDLLTKEDKILFTDDIRTFCISPDNSILYTKDRSHQYGSEVWCYLNGKVEKLWETDYLIHELEANENLIVASVSRNFENPDIYELKLETRELIPVLSTPWREGNLCLTKDNKLQFTANFNGKNSLYEIDPDEQNIWQLTTNGFAQSGVKYKNILYYIGLNRDGYDIHKSECVPAEYTLPDWTPSIRPTFGLDENHISHGGYCDLLKTFLPAVRVPFIFPANDNFSKWFLGGLVLGGDATLENTYYGYILYDAAHVDSSIANISWRSMFLSPLYIDFQYKYPNSIHCRLNYPLLARLSSGLNAITLYADENSFDHFARKEISAGISVRFSYPLTTFYAKIWFPFERQNWGSSIDRNAQFASLGINQFFKDGNLSLFAIGGSDTQNPDTISLPLRGYGDTLLTTRGMIATTEYCHRLFSVRQGLWEPNIYLEDLFGKVFIDYGLAQDKESFYSVGCELSLEIKTGFGYLQLIQKVGVALNKDGQVSFYFGLVPATQNPYFLKKKLVTHSTENSQ